MKNYEYKAMPESMADSLEKIKAEQYAEYRSRSIGQFVSDHSSGGKCDHNTTEMRPGFISGEPLTIEQMREVPHGKIGDRTLKSICDRANEIAYYLTHIDLEAWKECPWCKAEYTIIDDDFGQPVHMNMVKFCWHCGKPLTKEAKKELEDRLRG